MAHFPDNTAVDLENILTEEDCADKSLREQAAINTYEWLLQNDFIYQKSREIGMIKYMVMPSEKLLVRMGEIPSSLKERKQTLLDFFMDNSRAGVGSAIQNGIQMLLGMN